MTKFSKQKSKTIFTKTLLLYCIGLWNISSGSHSISSWMLSDRPCRKKITAGARDAQGSILGPDFWNVSYDRTVRVEMPPDTFLVDYADDIAEVLYHKTLSMHKEAWIR